MLKTWLRTWISLAGLTATLALPIAASPAAADGTRSTNCVHLRGSLSCVTRWQHWEPQAPKAPTEQELAEARAREQQWQTYCRPYIWQDELGVRRYGYSERGCEYGRVY
jgi:hypothetical protein